MAGNKVSVFQVARVMGPMRVTQSEKPIEVLVNLTGGPSKLSDGLHWLKHGAGWVEVRVEELLEDPGEAEAEEVEVELEVEDEEGERGREAGALHDKARQRARKRRSPASGKVNQSS